MSPLSSPLAAPVAGTAPVAGPASPAGAQASDHVKLAGASKQFEAIFVRQMLAAARKSSFGDDNFGGQGIETFRQMQDERFADIAAESGAFGLGRTIEAQLAGQIKAGE